MNGHISFVFPSHTFLCDPQMCKATLVYRCFGWKKVLAQVKKTKNKTVLSEKISQWDKKNLS